jgi:hypothetical protein
MTHELIHMAFPSVRRRHHWIEQGLATYVEPVARAQVGTLSAERVWADLMRDLPRGEPGAGDGASTTPTAGDALTGVALCSACSRMCGSVSARGTA